ncbi:hypothetical protein EDD76_12425 [Kineothrix alysoides]|uniref:Cof subfamily protein (Haloacid dehalogenase superfamily)/HAD superfamily hydrolase (TIGR01484 family) n=1 Tax=Kineothrix alysoides TaxID=1469948 RepID=A0A4R1QSS8_9FIRM|nr:Cof-type HAD-IIB family hydrolase [Kineothrix alysoides]TCL53904.1 hypothetical protein EDD76_12425 [Kineothrix alysoides]
MENIKIAFFDIDGTLIDINKKKMTKRIEETLIRLKQNKIIICIATGRPLKSVPHFPNIEFDAFLTFNASYCCTKNEIIYKNPIPPSDVQTIIENAKKIHRPVSIASAIRMGANGKDQDLIDYFAISDQLVEVVEDFDDLKKDDIYQIMMGCYKEEYGQVLNDVEGAKITAWWPRAVDIIPANGGKGLGVEKILNYYNLKKEEAIAFGDGTNDIEMLQAVGTGVAMGNATNDVKDIADDTCESVAEDGIYFYCKKYHLI